MIIGRCNFSISDTSFRRFQFSLKQCYSEFLYPSEHHDLKCRKRGHPEEAWEHENELRCSHGMPRTNCPWPVHSVFLHDAYTVPLMHFSTSLHISKKSKLHISCCLSELFLYPEKLIVLGISLAPCGCARLYKLGADSDRDIGDSCILGLS